MSQNGDVCNYIYTQCTKQLIKNFVDQLVTALYTESLAIR